MSENFRRRYKRAPLRSDILYRDQQVVLKAQILNISEGGAFLENLPHIPEGSGFPVLFKIVFFPVFSQLSPKQVELLSTSTMRQEVIQMQAKVVRQVKGNDEDEVLFVPRAGCSFTAVNDRFRDMIAQYVEIMEKNFKFLLANFEGRLDKTTEKRLRKLSGLLHYQQEHDIGLLRLRVLHDYQSLER